MKQIAILIFWFVLSDCSDQKKVEYNEQVPSDYTMTKEPMFKNDISNYLSTCIPENWIEWEEFSEDKKTYLAHIGKGIFDLHFKANYELKDTLLGEDYNGKVGNTYYPEIVLHFYKNEVSIKESVKFTIENAEIISDMAFAEYFGETQEFLIYECLTEKQIFQPEDSTTFELRECLIEKITTYNIK